MMNIKPLVYYKLLEKLIYFFNAKTLFYGISPLNASLAAKRLQNFVKSFDCWKFKYEIKKIWYHKPIVNQNLLPTSNQTTYFFLLLGSINSSDLTYSKISINPETLWDKTITNKLKYIPMMTNKMIPFCEQFRH